LWLGVAVISVAIIAEFAGAVENLAKVFRKTSEKAGISRSQGQDAHQLCAGLADISEQFRSRFGGPMTNPLFDG
jgi:hypothetical protein